jgi:fructokinase
MLVVAIEAGGTKFNCAVFDSGKGRIETAIARPNPICRRTIATTRPEETLPLARDFLVEAASEAGGGIEAMGIGCFGPIDLHPGSPTWGHITTTPKPLWRGVDVAGFFSRELGIRIAFDTDVNAAALAEGLWGSAMGLEDFVYVTVGTGIGGGLVSGGRLVHGLAHPELGHLRLAREEGDGYEGCCPYHRDCLEGLASGPAIAARWGRRAEELEPGHPAWELEARYVARAFAAYVLVSSPERIILGGGVGMRPGLAESCARHLGEELGGYVEALADPDRLARFVTRPALGSEAGLFGAAALALREAAKR